MKGLLALVALKLLTAAFLVDAWWTSGSPCQYSGYKPAGTGAEPVSPLASPTIAYFNDTLSYAFDQANLKSDAAAAAIDLFSEVSKKASVVAKQFAVFGACFAIVGYNEAPAPNDILEKVGDAFEMMTEEMNKRIDDLQHYVDESILQLEKNLITKNFKTLRNGLAQSFGNYETEDEQLSALQRAVDDIMKDEPYFIIHRDAFELYLERKSKNEITSHLTDAQVSELEAMLPLFRPWCSLYLYNANTLVEGYKQKADSFKSSLYLGKIRDTGMLCYNYSHWAYEEMHFNKIGQYQDDNGNLIPCWQPLKITTQTPETMDIVGSLFGGKLTTYITATTIANCFPMNDGGRCKNSVQKDRGSNQVTGRIPPTVQADITAIENQARTQSIAGVQAKCEQFAADYERDFSTYWNKELIFPSAMFKVASEAAVKSMG